MSPSVASIGGGSAPRRRVQRRSEANISWRSSAAVGCCIQASTIIVRRSLPRMERHICVACGTQYPDATEPPGVLSDLHGPAPVRPARGQQWTTLERLRAERANDVRPEGDLDGIGTTPHFAIGQRALLVPFGDANLLWDCVSLLDDATAEEVERRGGLAGIAISHPHYYSCMVEWARRFDCPIHLHAADAEWVMRPDAAITTGTASRWTSGTGSRWCAAAGTSRAARCCTATRATGSC